MKNKLIKDLEENIYRRIKRSEISGVGVFAIVDYYTYSDNNDSIKKELK
jgi:hypothetical protein